MRSSMVTRATPSSICKKHRASQIGRCNTAGRRQRRSTPARKRCQRCSGAAAPRMRLTGADWGEYRLRAAPAAHRYPLPDHATRGRVRAPAGQGCRAAYVASTDPAPRSTRAPIHDGSTNGPFASKYVGSKFTHHARASTVVPRGIHGPGRGFSIICGSPRPSWQPPPGSVNCRSLRHRPRNA